MKIRNILSKRMVSAAAVAAVLASLLVSGSAQATSASEIRQNAAQALSTLYQSNPDARALAEKSRAILIFPHIVAGALGVGVQYGDGALQQRGRTIGYYHSMQGSIGFQAGVQSFGYVLFFMDKESLDYLRNSEGWELGTGPTLVVIDQGFAKTLSTTTMQKGVYAFIFNQQGVMAGIGIKGAKISEIHPG